LKQLLFDFKKQTWEELTTRTPVGYPNWSRDGKYLYYDTQSGNEPGFYRVRISDRKIERIVSFRDIARESYLFGPWAGLTPDESPLLVRDAGVQEIYALDVRFP
jgi:hypothetical protein